MNLEQFLPQTVPKNRDTERRDSYKLEDIV